MDERVIEAVAGDAAYVVGGAIRDELLGRPVLDVDVACPDPEAAARRFARAARGALFPLSERHGAWRVAFRDGRTVDFTPLKGELADDLRTRDFTVNAIARPAAGGPLLDPLGGVADLEARRLRAVSGTVFADDPLRLLRAVRLEDELGLRCDEPTEALVRREAHRAGEPAGERILAELVRLSGAGYRRAGELGLLAPLGGDAAGLDLHEPLDSPAYRLVCVFGEALARLPVSNETERLARVLLSARAPAGGSPREIFRFRRATEPWALEALAFVNASRLAPAVLAARAAEPSEPLLRGDELGLPPGPEIGRLLELVEEERAAGTVTTREEALALVARERERSRAGSAGGRS
jgi:hypothetical protein